MKKSLITAVVIAFMSVIGSQQALAGGKSYSSYKSYGSAPSSHYKKSYKSSTSEGNVKKYKAKWQPVSAC